MRHNIILLLFIIGFPAYIQAQVAINSTGAEPNQSAMLEVSSDTKGFLPPRMTQEQREQIQNPVNGLMIFNTSSKSINYYNGNSWAGLTDYVAPVTDFLAMTLSGPVLQPITFSDVSLNNPNSWLWDFGDGSFSTDQNPAHIFSLPGTYTVTLTAANSAGVHSEVKTDYIEIVADAISTCPGASTVTDVDGNEYLTVLIGDQCWMRENLNVTHYNNGDPIPFVSDSLAWISLASGSPAYCYLNNNVNSEYGALYNFAAASGDTWTNQSADGQGICPDGWHLPLRDDVDALEDYLIANGYNWDGTTSEDKIAKSLAVTYSWYNHSTPGVVGNDQASNNASGFSLMPGGNRGFDGSYYLEFFGGYFLYSISIASTSGYVKGLVYHQPSVITTNASSKQANSVRCIKNE